MLLLQSVVPSEAKVWDRYEQTTPKNEKTLGFWQGAFFFKRKKRKGSEERELALDNFFLFSVL
jgi:hypothetical protein